MSFNDLISAIGPVIPDNAANAVDIEQGGNDYINIDTTDGAEKLTLNGSAPSTATLEAAGNVVFNEAGDAAADFRVESDTNTHMLFVDSSLNRVGINDSTPTKALDVNGAIRATADVLGASWTWVADSGASHLRPNNGAGSTAAAFKLTGSIALKNKTATPTDVADHAGIYVKGGLLVITWLDGVTQRYKYLDLAGTGVTWVHATTAP